MISIKVLKEKRIESIFVKGHALYDDFGKDIVCSSVSSIVITTVNALLLIDKEAIEVDDKSGIEIKVLKDDDIVEKLLINMLNLLKELSEDYPKNIRFI